MISRHSVHPGCVVAKLGRRLAPLQRIGQSALTQTVVDDHHQRLVLTRHGRSATGARLDWAAHRAQGRQRLLPRINAFLRGAVI